MEKYKKKQKYKAHFLYLFGILFVFFVFLQRKTKNTKKIQNKYECNFSKIQNTKKYTNQKFQKYKIQKKKQTQKFQKYKIQKNTNSKMSQRANPMFILKSKNQLAN